MNSWRGRKLQINHFWFAPLNHINVNEMKRSLTLIVSALLLNLAPVKAQLLPQFSQYMFNDYLLNPALGGTHDYWQVKTNYRLSFQGITDGPQTYALGAYGPHKKLPMGYGGYIFNDVTGPISNMGVYGSYAYNIRITGDIRLSMGLFLGMVQQKIDLAVLPADDNIVEQWGDEATKFYPDGSLGLYLYTSQYFAGFTFNHLMFNNLTLLEDFDGQDDKLGRVKPQFNIQGGYKYNLNRNFDLEPTVFLKGIPDFDFMWDLNIRAIYQKMVWGGLGYRSSKAQPESLIFLVGYNYNDMINIGYSYDFTLSKLSAYSNGSHEIMVGFKFNDIRQSRSKRKIR